MTKLTNELKSTILDNACKAAGIHSEREKLQEATYDWADDIYALRMEPYKDVIPTILELEQAVKSKIPEALRLNSTNLLYRHTVQWCNIGGQTRRADYRGDPRVLDTQGKEFAIPASHPLAKRLTKLDHKAQDLQKKEDDVKTQVRAVLSSVNTVAQLLKVWPEAAELLPPKNQPAKMQLPAVQIQSLNEALGLPTESETE